MKVILRNKIHVRERSHDVTILQAFDTKFKLTYETYNAVERFNIEIFNGEKLNLVGTIMDLGIEINSSAYNILTPEQREKRVNEIFEKAKIFIKALF